ncbi:MAG: hypothetical protein EOP11_19030 [Proteobacteria bacterium]|nr:MAG: hypothetical protein EOP11_19030 [Pseudomonadota bacterium]
MQVRIFQDWQVARGFSDEAAASHLEISLERWLYLRENPHRIPVFELRIFLQRAFPPGEALEDAMEECFNHSAIAFPRGNGGSVLSLEDKISIYELKKYSRNREQQGPAS